MGTDLITSRFGGDLAAVKTYATALRNVAITAGADEGKDLLKVDKETGEWTFGQDETVLGANDEVAINPASFKHGYIAFDNKNQVAEDENGDLANILVPITAPLPRNLPELPEQKRGKQLEWKLQLAFDAVIISGKHKGTEVRFSPISRGGLRMMRKMTEEVARRLEDGKEDCVPVVELFSSSYRHKDYGTIVTPEFDIIAWAFLDDPDLQPQPKATPPERNPKKGEKTARGDAVDPKGVTTRKTSAAKRREAEAEQEDESEVLERQATEQTRGRGRPAADEVEDEKPARASRRGRDEESKADPEPAAERTRGRSARGRDEEPAAEDERPARSRRGRDEEPVDEAPARGRRGREEEPVDDERRDGVRGRGAAGGRRGVEEERPARRRVA